ncbi:MAG TPA: phage holin family protein, partial [Nannocystaceae bacterium]|nr:phage holin family protein [Nannocystaceae bacterium]
QLAVVEVREDARAAARVAVGFAVGAVLAVLAVAFVGAGAAFALALVLPAWAAFTIVGSVIAIGAAIAVAVARRKLASHDFTPERTIEMLQENRQWLADRTGTKTS